MIVERSDLVQLRYFTNGVHSPLPYVVWVKRPTEPIRNYDPLSGYGGGEWSYEQLLAFAEDKDKLIREELYHSSHLPKNGDPHFAAKVLMEVQDLFWNK